MQDSPIIHVSAMGNIGNRMIQFMAALALAARLPRVRFSKVELAEWKIQHPPLHSDPARTIVLDENAVPAGRIDLDGVAALLATGEVDAADVRCYAQQASNFLPPRAYDTVFTDPGFTGAGRDELLINIRQGDILDARHRDYVLAPVEFYEDLISRTGLSPVFMGQLDETPYLGSLRRRFPQARFIPSQGQMKDFSIIRNSVNIVLCVSTFSWVAAYLSRAKQIFMPVLGLFHPLQAGTVNLMPFGDSRFRFFLFPFHYAVKQDCIEAAHAGLRGRWQELPEADLRALFARAPAVPARGHQLCTNFLIESAYLRENKDVADAVAAGDFPSGRHHYAQIGWTERRATKLIDAAWYCATYPEAAEELGRGQAADPFQHWLDIGVKRGYRRCPDGA